VPGASPTAVTNTPTPVPPTATSTGGGFDVPAPKTPAGEAVLALGFGSVADQNGRNQAQSPELVHYYGIGETMFLRANDDSTLPWLATEWSLKPDLSGATLTIASGVKFHVVDGNDFGELTAEDVAWSMNDANATTNPNSIHGQAGDFAGLFKEWVAVDDNTIEFDFESFDNTWKDDFLNQSGQAFVVFSKKAFDDMGEAWVRDHVVATGPYQVTSWLRDTELTMEAVPNHWKFTPKTSKITIKEISESTTRSALLRNGEADVAALEAADAPPFIQGGFGKANTGGGNQEGLFFSGNLWEKYSAREGEGEGEPNEKLLERGTYANDFPWIGDPFSTSDPDDMEEARLVRRALAIAIDRESIVENVLSGLGKANMVQYFSTNHPNWDSKWDYYYDPDEAAQIISDLDANYFKGAASSSNLNGNAFEISIYSQDGNANVRGEIADAVAGFWSAIGLETYSLKFSYRTFRPGVVARTNTLPWLTQCDKGVESTPWSFPKGLVESSLSRGGFSCGFETPEITEFYQRMASAPDQATAVQAANEYLDYVYFWNLQPGVVTLPADVYYNPNKIASWDMGKSSTSATGNYWNLTLK
jgi:ABC-type transport system substrate-binding protein